jgi:RNA polymerase sigma-B factor
MPLAEHIAYRYVGRGEPSEDLIQVARLGLIKTVDRYDPTKGRFLPYAVRTMLGEVRRHFRDNTWAMHVPRRIKETHQRVRSAIEPLSQRLGGAPTNSELATGLDVGVEEIALSMEAACAYQPTSFDAQAPDGNGVGNTVADRHGTADPRFESVEDRLVLADVINRLPRRERMILKMRFCDGLTQTQIAMRVGISQVHVSRLLATTLDRLRTQLTQASSEPNW